MMKVEFEGSVRIQDKLRGYKYIRVPTSVRAELPIGKPVKIVIEFDNDLQMPSLLPE